MCIYSINNIDFVINFPAAAFSLSHYASWTKIKATRVMQLARSEKKIKEGKVVGCIFKAWSDKLYFIVFIRKLCAIKIYARLITQERKVLLSARPLKNFKCRLRWYSCCGNIKKDMTIKILIDPTWEYSDNDHLNDEGFKVKKEFP